MNRPGEEGMWDEEDGFYYDLLRLPDGSSQRLKVRSMVGLLPLCATTVIEKWQRESIPGGMPRSCAPGARMPELLDSIHKTGPGHLGVAERGILALVNEERLRRILSKMLDENEFLSPYGIRSLSKFHHEATPTFSTSRAGIPGGLPAGRIEHGHVRRQLQLARPGLDARQRHPHPGAAELLPVLRRQLQNRVPDRLRQDDEPLRGEQGDRRPAGRIFTRDEDGARRPSTAARRSSRPIRTGGTTSSSTNTSTATTAPASAPATRPAGPGWWPRPSSSSDCWIRKRPSEGKKAFRRDTNARAKRGDHESLAEASRHLRDQHLGLAG
jgi:hypothetical protein